MWTTRVAIESCGGDVFEAREALRSRVDLPHPDAADQKRRTRHLRWDRHAAAKLQKANDFRVANLQRRKSMFFMHARAKYDERRPPVPLFLCRLDVIRSPTTGIVRSLCGFGQLFD